jgi:hypothetical protein
MPRFYAFIFLHIYLKCQVVNYIHIGYLLSNYNLSLQSYLLQTLFIGENMSNDMLQMNKEITENILKKSKTQTREEILEEQLEEMTSIARTSLALAEKYSARIDELTAEIQKVYDTGYADCESQVKNTGGTVNYNFNQE